MAKRIKMIEGSSLSNEIIEQVKQYASGKQKILVCLDSNHTHEHVLKELRLYAPFVSHGSYIVVFDTIIEYLPDNYLPGRAWGQGNNPKTAVLEFLTNNTDFVGDEEIDNKLLISVAPGGYLKRIK
jgi:cephalosporin hydroxylase